MNKSGLSKATLAQEKYSDERFEEIPMRRRPLPAFDMRPVCPLCQLFAEAFVGGLPQSWINDPSEAIGRHADQLVAMYAAMARRAN